MADLSKLSDDELQKLHALKSMSDEDLVAKHQGRPGYLSPRTPAEGGGMHPMESAARTLGHGASFGYSDELMALAREQMGQGEYEGLVQAEREKYEQIPASAKVMGDVVGGTATALAAPLAIPGKVAQAGSQIAARLPGWLKASGLAGAYGALYGSGTAEEGERLEGAKSGGATGAALGAAGYPIVKGVQYVGGKIGESIGKRVRPPGSAARATVGRRAAMDEMTQARMQQRLKDLGPQATLYDAGGPNVQGLGRHVASVPGPAQNRAQILLNQRAQGEAARVNRAVAKGLDPEDYYAAEEGFLNTLRTRAKPLYDEAYTKFQSVTSKPLQRVLQSKTGKKALREAMDIAENEGIPMDVEAIEAGNISLQMWDDIKRGFDSLLDKGAYRNELTGRLNTKGFSVDSMRRRLLKELDQATGGKTGLYAKARATYAGDAEVLGALKDGRKALLKDPEVIAKRLGELSDAGKEAYRSGVARALKDEVSKVPGKGSAAMRIFGNSAKRARIRAAFPDQKSYRELSKALIAEQRFASGRAKAMTGSMTEPRRAESADILREAAGVAGVTAGTQAGKVLGAHTLMAAGIGRRVGRALLGEPKAHDLEVAKMLFARDQTANRQIIDKIFEKRIWDSLPEATKKTIGRALMVGAGQQGAAASSAAQEYLE